MEQSLSNRIISNTAFNILGRFWSAAVSLALTPYIVGRLGADRFGIWALAGAVTGYIALLDLGFGSSFVTFIAKHRARSDTPAINRLVSTGLFFHCALAVVAFAVAWCVVPEAVRLLRVPAALTDEAVFVFRVCAALVCCSAAMSVFQALLNGLQRMDVANAIAVGVSAVSIAGTVAVLSAGWGLRGLLAVNAAMLALGSCCTVVAAFIVFPALRVSARLCRAAVFRELFRFGWKTQVNRLEGVVTFQTDIVIIASALGVSPAGFYQVGNSLITKLRELPLLVVSAVVPAASELQAHSDAQGLRLLYERGARYLSMLGMPLMVFAWYYADRIVFAWMGYGFESAAALIRIFAPCYLINIISGAGTSVALGAGRPELAMRAGLAQMTANLALSLVLVRVTGFTGPAVATCVCLSLSSIWFMGMLHSHLGISSRAFVRKVVAPPAAAVGAAVAVLSLLERACGVTGSGSRAAVFTLLCAGAAIFCAVYAALLKALRCLDAADIDVLRRSARLLLLCVSRRPLPEGRPQP